MKACATTNPSSDEIDSKYQVESNITPWNLSLCVAVGCSLCIFAVSNQSLWIDEAVSGVRAMQPNLESWWREMAAGKGSDLQMPIYMLYLWGVAKLFGFSEVALRLAGALWIIPGMIALVSIFRKAPGQTAVIWALSSSAFVWYYLNEARPYAMQLGASCLTVAALYWLSKEDLSIRKERAWVCLFALGIVVLSGSSLLGVIWVAAALVGAWGFIPKDRRQAFWKRHWVVSVITGLIMLGLGIFYLWTLTSGARASAAARTSLQTMVFVFYEQLGFSGLGPGRTDLRSGGINTLLPYAGPLGLYAVLLFVLLAAAGRRMVRELTLRRVSLCVVLSFIPLLLLVVLGIAMHFRVLGRHCTPLMPLWFAVIAFGIVELWGGRRMWGKICVIIFLLLGVGSCSNLRFAERHARDDYRSAAIAAKRALEKNQKVWWNAAKEGAIFYCVPLMAGQNGNGAVLMISPTDETLATFPPPDVLISSKPDLWDRTGAVARYREGKFQCVTQLPAFTIWGANKP